MMEKLYKLHKKEWCRITILQTRRFGAHEHMHNRYENRSKYEIQSKEKYKGPLEATTKNIPKVEPEKEPLHIRGARVIDWTKHVDDAVTSMSRTMVLSRSLSRCLHNRYHC
jgi:hypothetical protein